MFFFFCYFLFFFFFFFFFNDTATTEIYTLSLHDALPISWTRSTRPRPSSSFASRWASGWGAASSGCRPRDRKSTRLNSSHVSISYAVFCLKKKTEKLPLRYSLKQT